MGKFIAFEGIDGSGKTAQAKLMHEYLSRSSQCILTQEPMKGPIDIGPIGEIIGDILNKHDNFDSAALQLLFCADRAYHVNKVINPALKEGKHVITDRYFLSTIAYGAASGLDKEWLESVNSKFTMPDMIFIIDADPATALERRRKQNTGQNLQMSMFEKQVTFAEKVREIYLQLQKEYRNSILIDGNRKIEEVHEEVIRHFQKHV